MCISHDTLSRVLLLVWSVDTLALRAEIQAPDEVLYTSSVPCAGLSLYLLRPSPVSFNTFSLFFWSLLLLLLLLFVKGGGRRCCLFLCVTPCCWSLFVVLLANHNVLVKREREREKEGPIRCKRN